MTFPATPDEFRRILRARNLRLNKALGQCFLVDSNFLDALVRWAGITPQDEIIELGTGAGHLTSRLCDHAARVWSFEVDPAIYALARELLGARSNLRLILGDGASFETLARPSPAYRLLLVSNLPYSDYERLLLKAFSSEMGFDAFYFMVQRDVFARLKAGPGTPGYGPLGALLQGLGSLRLIQTAGPALFHPRPRVDSAFFSLKRTPGSRVRPRQIPALYQALRHLFAHRRKLLKATLHEIEERRGPLPASVWASGDKRVEELRPETLLELAAPVAAAGISPIRP
jgi:16S rRNA (adenine1518-N6/adenine1519-N6)-dimethyltransferase